MGRGDSPSAGGVGWAWVKDELNSKADQKWVEAKVEDLANRIHTLEKGNDETKKIGLAARKKAMEPHVCNRADTLDNIEVRMDGIGDKVESWTNWWKKIMITVVVAIVVSAGTIVGWLYSHKVLKDDVGELQTDVTKLEGSVQRIEKSQGEMKAAFDKSQKEAAEKEAKQVTDMQDALRSVLTELDVGKNKRR